MILQGVKLSVICIPFLANVIMYVFAYLFQRITRGMQKIAVEKPTSCKIKKVVIFFLPGSGLSADPGTEGETLLKIIIITITIILYIIIIIIILFISI